ncbi:MAG: NAD(P)/FAD-dependent oxidoreductase [Clostridium sp.]|nr:NAD(P)/FAD-dependent oxidoreductase [Clostridium sp.]
MKKKQVIIVGAGASGMTAAIFAARQGAEVVLLEHKDRVGKKILSTGNGKCNLSNRKMDASCYRSSVSGFPMKVIRQFPVERTLEFFESLGVVIKDRNGYLYPWSGQASAILDVLRTELKEQKVRVVTECEIHRILPPFGKNREEEKQCYRVETGKGVFQGDCLILAAGSKAAPGTGSDGSGYKLAAALGHRIVKPLPALVQLKCRESFYKQITGVRTDGRVTLWSDGDLLSSDSGELQLTDYGISGIPVFQVSRYAVRALDEGKKVSAVIDFCPELSRKQVAAHLRDRRERGGERTLEELFTGWIHKKLALLFLKRSNLRTDRPVKSLTDAEIRALTVCVKEFRTEIIGSNSFEQAQICCGGVDVREVDPFSLESKKWKGLYLIGELLDVDGICGGYNLQWAWSTGAIAGTHAGTME